jgi:transposase-like protein
LSSKEAYFLTPKKEFEQAVKRDVEARIRESVKAVLEEVLQEEMTQHLDAGYRELTPRLPRESATATIGATS